MNPQYFRFRLRAQVFVGNEDQATVRHHCLHRLFGEPVKARVVRFLPVRWHRRIGLRFEVYGFRGTSGTLRRGPRAACPCCAERTTPSSRETLKH